MCWPSGARSSWQLATNFLDRTSTPTLLEPADWFLLRQEAARLGLKVTDAQADERLRRIPPVTLNGVRKNMQVSMDDIRNARSIESVWIAGEVLR